ncbi:MAG TPA: carboxypeptidase-like regulatory domain-containing protein [Rubricoccaceae bacterium]
MTPTRRLTRPALLAALALFTVLPAAAQTALVGTVADTDGLPIPGATVYLSGTTRGTQTDDAGRFRLAGVAPGAYRLVASFVGYTAGTQDIRVLSGQAEAGPFAFRLAPISLGEVVIEGRGDERFRRRLETFTRELIGQSENGRLTTITNPQVLDFRSRAGALVATASAPLVIENRALGYRLVYDLRKFESTTTRVSYDGEERFEELTPTDDAERARWETARAQAYRGSLRHLLRTLRTGTAEAEGFRFRLRRLTPEGQLAEYAGRETTGARLVTPPDSAGFFNVLFNGSAIAVRFDGEPEVPAYLESEWFREARSAVNPFQESDLISTRPQQTIDASGNPEDPDGISASGYLAFERLSDLVPAEYQLPTSSTRTTIQSRRPPSRGGREQ